MAHVSGYYEVFIRSAVIDGQPLPPHQRMYLRLAPLERPEAVLAFASNDGSTDSILTPSHVTDVAVVVDGYTFFGFGAAGMVGAGLASVVDSWLAPWELRVSGPMGYATWYSPRGPSPHQSELDRVHERMYLAQLREDEISGRDDEAFAAVVRAVELAHRRVHAQGLDLILIDLDRAFLGEVVEPKWKAARAMRKVVDRWQRAGVLPDHEHPEQFDLERIRVVREVYRDRDKRLWQAVRSLRECADVGAYADADPEAHALWMALLVTHHVVAVENGVISDT